MRSAVGGLQRIEEGLRDLADATGRIELDGLRELLLGERVALEVFLTPIQEADEQVSGVLGLFRAPRSG